MDRRSLVVGGAAALAAVAGGRILPAHASTGTRSFTTADHARLVLNSVTANGLINPEGAQARLDQSFATYLAAPPRDPNADDLHAWAEQRLTDLTGGAEMFTNALAIPETRTLMAFGFMIYSQHQDVQVEISRSMPVPTVLSKLEPDFFPELLHQIEGNCLTSRAFGEQLAAAGAEVERFVDRASNSGTASMIKERERALYVVNTIIIVFLLLGAWGRSKDN